MHNAIKKFLGKKCHLIEFIKSFEDLVRGQQLERLRAALKLGDLYVNESYQSNIDVSDPHFNKFLKCEPPVIKVKKTIVDDVIPILKSYAKPANLTKIMNLPVNEQADSHFTNDFRNTLHTDNEDRDNSSHSDNVTTKKEDMQLKGSTVP